MTKLTSLQGAENLPQPIKPRDPRLCLPPDFIQHNKVVRELKQCGIVLDKDNAINIILYSMIKESIRNKNTPFHDLSYIYSPYCSCGLCYMALLAVEALASQPEKFIKIVKE